MLIFALFFLFPLSMYTDFITTVELPLSRFEINHSHSIMLLGSCFSEHIGKRLKSSKFSCDVNPMGVLYNPISIAESLYQILDERLYVVGDTELIEKDGWHSLMHHSSFSALTQEACVTNINARLSVAALFLKKTDVLFLTFGSAYVYRWKADGRVVGNCHKLAERYFTRERLSCEEIVEAYVSLIQRLKQIRPDIKLLFTVSPIRHRKDGMHGNQVSKATLLLAIERLTEIYPEQCFYFPSYEIVLDELRDYRFYADDMLHPSEQTVSYIWKRFGDCYFSKETKNILEEWEKIRKGMEHRPFNVKSSQYKEFLSQLVLRMERLKEKYPNFVVEKEIEQCYTLLNRLQN